MRFLSTRHVCAELTGRGRPAPISCAPARLGGCRSTFGAAIGSWIVLPERRPGADAQARGFPGRREARRYMVRRIGPGTAVGPRRPGGAMPTVIGHYDVKDIDYWLASPKREEFFGPLGVTNIRTFVDPEKPTRVGVLMDVADMDVVRAAMEAEGAAEAIAYDGVLPEPLVILVEA